MKLIRGALVRGLIIVTATLLPLELSLAEILNSSTNYLRIRLGGNARSGSDTVIYSAGIPASMGGLTGVTADPDTESVNQISGSSGIYKVRIVTDVNTYNGLGPLTALFTYDSSNPMSCSTALSCGGTTIDFRTIRWKARDGDTLDAVLQYDGTANQVFQKQRDTDDLRNRLDTRHRNHYQYIFDNSTLLPAGTYDGAIQAYGVGDF